MDEFDDYVTSSSRGLLRAARLLTGNNADAEDLVQQALANTYRKFEELNSSGASYEAYVRRTMHNLYVSQWRRRQAFNAIQHLLAHAPSNYPDPSETGFIEMVQHLPLRQRQVVILKYLDDLTEVAIAETLSISTGSVKTHLHRAKKTLQKTRMIDTTV